MDDSSDEAEDSNMSRPHNAGQATDDPTPTSGEGVASGHGNSEAPNTRKPEQIAKDPVPTSGGGVGSGHGDRDDIPDDQHTNVYN